MQPLDIHYEYEYIVSKIERNRVSDIAECMVQTHMSIEEALTCSEILTRRMRPSCSLGPKVHNTSFLAGSQHVDVMASPFKSTDDFQALYRMLRRLRILKMPSLVWSDHEL